MILIAMVLFFTTGQCKTFHDLPTFVVDVPAVFRFNDLPAKIQEQVFQVQTVSLLTCMRVSKAWYSLIFGKLYKFRSPILFNTDF